MKVRKAKNFSKDMVIICMLVAGLNATLSLWYPSLAVFTILPAGAAIGFAFVPILLRDRAKDGEGK